MSIHWRLACGLLLVVNAAAAAAPRIEKNSALRFEFPDLPATLESMDSGKTQPLLGGPGGRGEERDLRLGSDVIGQRDWIVVTMPLFRKHVDPSEMSRGLMVSMDDYAVIAPSYRAMLEKLFAAVPGRSR